MMAERDNLNENSAPSTPAEPLLQSPAQTDPAEDSDSVSVVTCTTTNHPRKRRLVQMTLTPPIAAASTSESSTSNEVSEVPDNSITGTPANSKSAVWPYFTLTEDGNWVTCNMCREKVSRKQSNTTNMKSHLQKHHPSVFANHIQDKQLPRRQKANSKNETNHIDDSDEDDCQFTPRAAKKKRVTGPMDYYSNKYKSIPKNSVHWNNLTDGVLGYVVESMVPNRHVELSSFKEMLRRFEPGYTPPSRKYLSQTAIPKRYSQVVEAMKSDMGRDNYYAVTSDGWSSAVNLNPYISMTYHYINQDWKYCSLNLETLFAPESHTALYVAGIWSAILANWKLDEAKLVAITTDNGANMVAAAREAKFFRVPCFGHVLHNGVNNSLTDDRITQTKAVAKKVVAAFSHSYGRRKKMATAQSELGLPRHTLKADCSTRWGSTHAMMARLLEQQDAVKRVLVDDNRTSHLLANWWEMEQVLTHTTSALQEYVSLTDGLSGDTHVTISSVLPLLYHIESQAKSAGEGVQSPNLDVAIHKSVSGYMKPKYEDPDLKAFLIRATLLDPRYTCFVKTVYHQQYIGARLTLMEEMKEEIESTSRTELTVTEPTPPGSGGRCLADILQNVTMATGTAGNQRSANSNVSSREKARQEIDRYLTAPVLPTKSASGQLTDPLLWWKRNQSAYPTLAIMARRYLCVPATSVSSERMFSKSGHIINKKRNKLSPKMANMLTFLNANNGYCG